MTVDGKCDPRFAAVREVFTDSLDTGADLGAAVAVSVGGRSVVDLWGGVADGRSGRAWQRDTACVTFSCTKAVTTAAVLLLAERGGADLDAPMSDWWPEFAAHGKGAVTTEDVLTHRAGLPAFDREVTVAESGDAAAMAAQLAGQPPEWTPGTAHGYHAVTFGWLAGEYVRRSAGVLVGEFVQREIGADLHVGVTHRALESADAPARIAAGRPMRVPPDEAAAAPADIGRLAAATADPTSTYRRSTGNPAASFNDPLLLTAGWPAAGLVCTARALAEFYDRLATGRIVSSQTVRWASAERVRGADRTLVLESAFALGFMRASASMLLPPAARDNAFGHPGASGALAFADPQTDVAFAYVPNLARPSSADRRAYHLARAVYEAL
ncbi:serine hydrolase domain-containing protein [uncultured Jatrophihabitans sp.]|uniref:serine hydrolase domain-containing protein n=1 Tax=uncultured Jatrophihabitans sp. TaxID=1610747 RepID=UPI0035C9D180